MNPLVQVCSGEVSWYSKIIINHPVQTLRYHGFFIGSSVFALIYDMFHNKAAAPAHLPWIATGLQCLYSMREGEPIASTIRAIELALNKLSEVDNIHWTIRRDGAVPHASHCNCQFLEDPAPISSRLSDERIPLSQPSSVRDLTGFANFGDPNISNSEWDLDPSTVNLEEFFSWPLLRGLT